MSSTDTYSIMHKRDKQLKESSVGFIANSWLVSLAHSKGQQCVIHKSFHQRKSPFLIAKAAKRLYESEISCDCNNGTKIGVISV